MPLEACFESRASVLKILTPDPTLQNNCRRKEVQEFLSDQNMAVQLEQNMAVQLDFRTENLNFELNIA